MQRGARLMLLLLFRSKSWLRMAQHAFEGQLD